ncbi:Nuclear protein localization protein 4 [Saguinus oedipus]|uniref:Nuclear protein localization protein 4 n=1 Tax=Saguinus oedipus TaxID=9490 RepID=A0ABQ9VT98_SAGOE|nr:Nuclear protein localization protein 4 [Saguinus oedipus]
MAVVGVLWGQHGVEGRGRDRGACSCLPLAPAHTLEISGTVGVQLPGLQEYGAVGGTTHTATAAMWACQHCTFMNQPGTGHCEMCSLPRT